MSNLKPSILKALKTNKIKPFLVTLTASNEIL